MPADGRAEVINVPDSEMKNLDPARLM